MPTTKAEQETIIRYDQEERIAQLWTAYPHDAHNWEHLGYPVRVHGRTQDGSPRSWTAEVPIDAVRWRPMKEGVIVRKRGHLRGRLLGVRCDELIAPDAEGALR